MKRILGLFVLLAGLVGLMGCKPKPTPEPPTPEKTDQEIVDEVYESLDLGNLDNLTNESPRLIFPATKDGTTIEWNIDKEYILSTGMINQPSHEVGDQSVVITATIKKGDAQKVKTFQATVKALPKPSEQAAYLDEDFKGFEDGDIIPQTSQGGVWGLVSNKAGTSTFHVVSQAPKPIPEDSKALKINAHSELQIETNIAHDVDFIVFEADFLQTPNAKAIQLQNHTSGSGSTFAFGITGSSVYYRIGASGEMKPGGNIANSEWFRLRVELDYTNKTFELFKYDDGNLVSLSGLVEYTTDVSISSLYIRSGSSNETSLNPNSSYITNIRVNRIEALPRPKEAIKLGEITGIDATLSLELGTEYTNQTAVVKGLYGSQDILVLDMDYSVAVTHEIDKDVAGEYEVTYTFTNLHDQTDVKIVKQVVTMYSDSQPNEIQTATTTVVGYETQTTDLTISFVRAEGALYYAFAEAEMTAEAIKALDKKVLIAATTMEIKDIAVDGKKNLYLVVENESGFSLVKEVVLTHQTVIEVKTAEEFYQMTQTTTEGLYYVLKNDIDFIDYDWVYKNISFRSTFNGEGFTVKNITINATDRAGIFSRLNGATVKNLVVENLNAQTTNRIGGIVGEVHGNGATIENIVMVNATIKGADDNGVAGIAGFVNKTTLNIDNISVIDSNIETTGKTVSAVVGRVEGAVATKAYLNLNDVFVSGVNVKSTTSATSDVGVSALLGYIRNGEGLSTLKKVIIVDTKLTGPMAGAVIGYVRDNAAAVLEDIYVQTDITFSDTRAGIVGRYNGVAEKFDVSKVYGKLTFSQPGYEEAPHTESSMLITENILEVAAITRSFVENTLLLDSTLWEVNDLGAPVLKNALLLLIPSYTVTIKYEDNLADDLILSVKEGFKVVFDAPEITGYSYVGLFTDIERTQVYDLESLITGDLTLYAKYEQVTTATVSFDTQGGPDVDDVVVNIDGTLEAFPDVENTLFEDVMKKVVGWTLDGATFELSTPITADITLIAVWEEVKYKVLVSGVEQIVSHGKLAIEPETPTTEMFSNSFVFDKWLTDMSEFDFSTPITSDLVISASFKLREGLTGIQINNPEDFHYTTQYSLTHPLELGQDIDFSGYEWVYENKNITADIDGKGHTIKNISIPNAGDRAGIFARFTGSIKNLVIDNVEITTTGRGAILIGETTGDVLIENVVIKNSKVEGNNGNGVGGFVGLVGKDTTTVNNSAIIDSVVYNQHGVAGGVAGRTNAALIVNDFFTTGLMVKHDRNNNESGSAAIVAFINGELSSAAVNRAVIENFEAVGYQVAGVIGYIKGGNATLNEVFVDAKLTLDYTPGTTTPEKAAGIIARYNPVPETLIDVSKVYGQTSETTVHSQSQDILLENVVNTTGLTQAWWTENFTLGDLWTIKETGIAVLTLVQPHLPVFHDVTVVYEDAHGLENDIISVLEGEALEFEAKEIIGFEFDGLYLDSEFTEPVSEPYLVNEAVTLYAKYTISPPVTVTFQTGSAVEPTPVEVNKGSSLDAFPVVDNREIEGVLSQVVGWTLNGEPFTLENIITENITLVAVWEAVTYQVSIDGVIQTVNHGTVLTEPAIPAHVFPEQYTFNEWQVGGVLFDFATPVESDLVITSTFTKNADVTQLDITNPEQLHFAIFNEPTLSLVLKNDINLADFDWEVPAETKFSGDFDGGNFTISNLTANSPLRSALFPIAQSGTIKNVVIDNASMISTGERNAILIGEIEGTKTLTIENIVIKNSKVEAASGNGAGGLIGFIKNSPTVNINNVAILNTTINNTTEKYAGGLIARAEGGTINVSDVYIKDITVTTNRTGTDAGSAAILGYLRNAATTINLSRAVVDNATLNGDATGAVIGYNNGDGKAVLTDVFVKATLNGVQRSAGIVTRYNPEPETRIDASDVYGILTGTKENSQSQQLDTENNVTEADLTEAWWTENFILGELWSIPETGIASLKIAH